MYREQRKSRFEGTRECGEEGHSVTVLVPDCY